MSSLLRRLLAGLILAVLAFLAIPVVQLERPLSTVLLDRDGRLIGGVVAADEQWRFPPSDDVPHKYVVAVQRFEDARFRWHPGVDPISLLRAVGQNLGAGHVVSGASTLTMQVVRISQDNPPRTLPHKLLEMVLALRLDAALGKDEILALYAHNAPFGGNVVGIEAAAWRYFGRQAAELSWAEAATLAVLPNSPGLIHPGRNRDALRAKRDRLLDALVADGTLSAQDGALAKAERLPDAPVAVPQLAPHLLWRAGGDARLFRTTLDRSLQRRATDVVVRHHASLSANGIHSAAAVILDVESGDALTWIGNIPDLSDRRHGHHVDVITAPRSTGSLLKPFLYEAMLEEGRLLPNQLVPDVPMRMGGFAPENFDRLYEGAVPASAALARSRNVPAAWMLREYGVDRFKNFLQRRGMTTLHRPADDYGLPLILGGAEGTLLEMTAMYRELAWTVTHPDDGRPTGPEWLQGVDRSSPDGAPLDPGAAWLTLDALEEVGRPGVHSGWRGFDSGRRVAWKTGTSFGFRDGWAIGVTPTHAIGVWVGNADGEGRPGLTGLSAAAPILFDLFDAVPHGPWFEPPHAHLVQVSVCAHSGMRAGPDCPVTESALAPTGALRATGCSFCERVHCDEGCEERLHADCSTASERHAEGRFSLPPAQEWFYARRHPSYEGLPPWRDDCRESADAPVQMALLYPKRGSRVYVPRELDGSRGRVVLEATHMEADARIHWHLDEDYLATTANIHQLAVDPSPGPHVLVLVDQDGSRIRRQFEVLSAD